MTIDHEIGTKNSSNCAVLLFLVTLTNLLALVLIISRWRVQVENLGLNPRTALNIALNKNYRNRFNLCLSATKNSLQRLQIRRNMPTAELVTK